MVAPDLSPEVIAARIKAAFLAKQAAEAAEARTYGLRTAARNIAARNGTDPTISVESWRKQLQRILDARAIKPHALTRRLLAEEFGCDPAEFGVVVGSPVSGGTMFADLLDSIREAQRLNRKLEQRVVLLAERLEGVAA